MLAEYDFSNAARGKYARQFGGGRNIVVLEPDVARMFKDSEAGNQALRAGSEIILYRRKKVRPRSHRGAA